MLLELDSLSLRSGEQYVRVYAIEVAPVLLGGERYDVLIADGVMASVDRVAGGFMVHVSADAKLYGPCARCLNEAVLAVHVEQQEFAPTARGGWAETELSAFIKDLVVDLSGLVREAVVLALPGQVICSVDCRGLCPHCGGDLNRQSVQLFPGGDRRAVEQTEGYQVR